MQAHLGTLFLGMPACARHMRAWPASDPTCHVPQQLVCLPFNNPLFVLQACSRRWSGCSTTRAPPPLTSPVPSCRAAVTSAAAVLASPAATAASAAAKGRHTARHRPPQQHPRLAAAVLPTLCWQACNSTSSSRLRGSRAVNSRRPGSSWRVAAAAGCTGADRAARRRCCRLRRSEGEG